ncbi:DUF2235 domain-containing protein [Paludisphaera soli]|uniref:DUF2235 domain-containing protein n=1 Tax=Paludisphaera soli TaxID=2712865 RepID=UPI0013EDBA52|nr:DUF2235 domain-containing protein [Paludisphaera soli]
MKRIVLCFDGTWNVPADDGVDPARRVETNVRRFHDSVAPAGPDGVSQEKAYFPGVGTGRWDKITGGVLGAGLDDNIREGYRRLVDLYDDGDEVYIVGFSRGAYTARSLVGMIRNSGLVGRRFAGAAAAAAYLLYRTRGDGPDSSRARRFRERFAREITIRFLGVWDTVGALGIPLELANRLNAEFYQFHDTELSAIVQRAYHALALDEHRRDYDAALWDPKEKPGQEVEQRWFAGAHSDVGGGYEDRRLSDIALRWMQDRAADAGLGLSRVAVGAENFKGTATDSYARFLLGVYARHHARHFRRVLSTHGNEAIDSSVDLRRGDPTLAYTPRNQGLPERSATAIA